MLTCESLLFFMRGPAAASDPAKTVPNQEKTATEEEGSCEHEYFDREEKKRYLVLLKAFFCSNSCWR
jgi:hypothetical protein